MPHGVAGPAAARQGDPLRLVQIAAAHRPEPHEVEPEVGGGDDAARQKARLVRPRHAGRLLGRGLGCLDVGCLGVCRGLRVGPEQRKVSDRRRADHARQRRQVGQRRKVGQRGNVRRPRLLRRVAVGIFGSLGDPGTTERAARIEREPHDAAVAITRGDHRVAGRGDRHVADEVTGIHRTAERREGLLTRAGERLHGARGLLRDVQHVEGRMRGDPRGRVGAGGDAREGEVAAGERAVGRTRVQHTDALGRPLTVGGVAADPEAHAGPQSTRSWRTITASRAGPTPMTEMRVPLIASSAST